MFLALQGLLLKIIGEGGTIRFLAACPLNAETKLMHADILVGSFHAQLSRPLAAALSPVTMTFGAERPRHARRYFEMAPGGLEFLPDMPDLVRIFLPNADLDKRPAMANVQTFRRAGRPLAKTFRSSPTAPTAAPWWQRCS